MRSFGRNMKAFERRDLERMQAIAAELERMTRYSSCVVFLRGQGEGHIPWIDELRIERLRIADSVTEAISLCEEDDASPALVIEDSCISETDFRTLIMEIAPRLPRGARILVVRYPKIGGVAGWISGWCGLPSSRKPRVSSSDEMFLQVARDARCEVVRRRTVGNVSGGATALLALIKEALHVVPLVRRIRGAEIAVLRPRLVCEDLPSLSLIVPARNECGTLGQLMQRLPSFGGAKVEIIFVEGHSSDRTWDAIQSLMRSYEGPSVIKAFKQSGVGKGDAVRLGFEKAENDLVAILDADFTVTPESLEEFYEAYRRGDGDLLNGNRLLFPMESGAMRPLNKMGNIFFARAVSFILDCTLHDTLCGTKLLRRQDYERMRRWRDDFGDFDPFGDFELLFPAAVLGIGIVDIPVRYKARVYGQTNIRRFKHGLQLLWMVLVGLWRIKIGARSSSHV